MKFSMHFYICLVFSLPSSLFCQTVTTFDSTLIQKIANDNFSFFYSVKELDAHFLNYLKKRKKFNIEIVEPFQEFNTTDMQIQGFPNKRLIVHGKGKLNTNFILYEVGGNALHNVCLIYQRKSKRNYDFSTVRLDTDVTDFTKLKTALEKGNYIVLL